MGKNKEKENKGQFRDKLSRIEAARKEIEKENKKIIIECSHQNEKGKLKIHQISDNEDYECKYCKTRFNMNPIKEHVLADAVKTVHDAIQQIRSFSDHEEDYKIIRILGELDFNVQETQELYRRVLNNYGRGNGKKKNKNRDRGNENSFGGYGGAGLSFIGGGKRR